MAWVCNHADTAMPLPAASVPHAVAALPGRTIDEPRRYIMDGDRLDTFQHRFRGRVHDRDFLVVAAVENGVDHRLHQQRVFNGMPGVSGRATSQCPARACRVARPGTDACCQGDREVANK